MPSTTHARRATDPHPRRVRTHAERTNRAAGHDNPDGGPRPERAQSVPGQRRRHRRRSEAELWLGALDATLGALEATAWELRGFADEALGAWQRTHESRRDAARAVEAGTAQLGRLTDSALVLARIGAGYRAQRFVAAFSSRSHAAAQLDALHRDSARRYTALSERQGGGFLKLGQLLSARPDLLPAVWTRELSRLQDAAPTFDFAQVRAAIEEDLGAPLEALFETLDPEPVAAASIGQVHRGRTHDGVEVAVKVRRPNIERLLVQDLALLERLLDALRSSLPPTDYDTIKNELHGALLGELDYAEEAAMMQHMHAHFEQVPGIRVPRPLHALCGARVLTAEWVDGVKITTALDALKPDADAGDATAAARRDALLGRLLQAYLMQVLGAGVFQADPHPGNLLVSDDDTLVLLDFGCTKSISAATRARYTELLSCFLRGDRAQMNDLFDALGFRTQSGGHDTLHAFAQALLEQLSAQLAGDARWPDRDSLIERARTLLDQAHADPVVTLPGEFVLLARVFGTLGGVFNHHRPRIDFARYVLPHLA